VLDLKLMEVEIENLNLQALIVGLLAGSGMIPEEASERNTEVLGFDRRHNLGAYTHLVKVKLRLICDGPTGRRRRSLGAKGCKATFGRDDVLAW
jgi:hypothetical protein